MAYQPDRFLRNSHLRESLYYDADGKCQNCGRPLGDDWHADHVVPWSVSHRTNVFEMQALCPTCNHKKGATMTENQHFDIDRTKLREGQLGAIDTIAARRRSNNGFTSVVLPTRYGKSDVARLSARLMARDGMVSNALIIVPAINLVEQLLDGTKLKASAEFYGFPREVFGQVQTINAQPRISRLKSSTISAITTHMANRHLPTLEQWVDAMKAPKPIGSGLPPVVYMDEAHLGSDGNR